MPDQSLAIINLLLYKEWAEFPLGEVTEKLTGQQAYERYSELSIPFVSSVFCSLELDLPGMADTLSAHFEASSKPLCCPCPSGRVDE